MLENHALRISLTLPPRLDAIFALGLLLSTLDPTFPARYPMSIAICCSLDMTYILRHPVLVRLFGPLGGGTFLDSGSGPLADAGPVASGGVESAESFSLGICGPSWLVWSLSSIASGLPRGEQTKQCSWASGG